eukprot:Plantae.Rhodophyta-Purpureofilum_apyrenoidigerum.ctg2832.p2 GENE.Plantae.Rhodophyta-Purpureofilum_apyrenoidigerum.ctg2832~~Plantae.Rhodophyta-Purpureofilum_apyrenoidigerum.ctg2832.p2  ORF type:complete len:205 (+),score=46.67 Plantae.Rhodophyta-Purpureofilum_apyrenoidigerum.ctg2832:151-765(+)
MEDTQIQTVDLFKTPVKDELAWDDQELNGKKKDDVRSAFRNLFTPSMFESSPRFSPDLGGSLDADLQVVPQFMAARNEEESESCLEKLRSCSDTVLENKTTESVEVEAAKPTDGAVRKDELHISERKRKADQLKAEYERLHKKKIREAAIIRFRQRKEERRNCTRQVRYECRKRIADARPRVKGRFVRKENYDDVAIDPMSYLK